MKIAFIGGGSIQWTLKLAAGMALTESLAESTLVLHDIDTAALDLLTYACQRRMAEINAKFRISSTLNRAEALRDADFVILCVAIGGLPAVHYDLEIPERYGIYQAVGDMVGPGGLARGLRHIPFAVQLAREMEQLCPQAWLLNLTNPLTTICRSVSRTTTIRVIGLCHEVDIVRERYLTTMLNAPAEAILLEVGGINHLPVILRCHVGGEDGFPLLRAWLETHGPFAFINDHNPGLRETFKDHLALKLTLFQQLGVLFSAGDRHVAEFLPGILTEANQHGARYGILLTTIAHREALARHRRQELEHFVAGAPATAFTQESSKRVAVVMAALAGGPTGCFIVNVPNQGQIDNLPRDAVVECSAYVDASGVHPIAAGVLPAPAYAIIAPHVARQELIVEAALTGQREPALAALLTDPLVPNFEIAEPMLAELLAANAQFMTPEFMGTPGI